MDKKNFKNILRVFISFVFLFLILYFNKLEYADEDTTPTETPLLYASVCHDHLQNVFFKAIQEAQQSITLVIYSLSDKKLITALNKKATEGVAVKVIHDATTPAEGRLKLIKLIQMQEIKMSGLMHQKILVVDHEKIWLGSANWTTESLRLHDNLVMAISHAQFAKAIENRAPFFSSDINEQHLEYWSLPEEGKAGLKRVISLIDQAKTSVRIAMFTWTHNDLTDAVLRAHKRGVQVEVIMDRGQAHGVCQKTVERLKNGGVVPSLNTKLGLLHHKCAWIDEEILIHGSANWTLAAFSRNQDCFIILYPLTDAQREKMQQMWQKTKPTTQIIADSLLLAA